MGGDILYRYYAVALIDVLGQKELFRNFDSASLKNDDPRLIDIHKQTAMVVERLREFLEHFLKPFSEESELILQVPESKREQFQEMRKTKVKTHRFSDCILVFTPLQTDKYYTVAINSVFEMLTACGAMMIFALSQRKTFRAALDVGFGTELSDGEVYGPVSYKVHELESKIAQYPRIVIGEELINFLRALSIGNKQMPDQTSEDIQVCKVMAENCLKMIINDLDGQAIFDYLGDDFRKNLNRLQPEGNSIEEKLLEVAFKFVENEYNKRKGMKDSKLALRYYLLYNYFKAKIKYKG